MIGLTAEDLRQHLRAAEQHDPQARVYGFHAPEEVLVPEEVEWEGRRCRVVKTRSELEIRAALVDQEEGELLVVVTPLEDREVALDVRCRLARRRLLEIDPWEAARTLFQATYIDGRLRGQRALGRALLRHTSAAQFPAVPSGGLGEELAWSTFLARGLGYDSDELSLDGLMGWACRCPSQAIRLMEEFPGLFEEFVAFARRQLGEPAAYWAETLRESDQQLPLGLPPGKRALVLALALEIWWKAHSPTQRPNEPSSDLADEGNAREFAIRLERYGLAVLERAARYNQALGQAARRALRQCREDAPDAVQGVAEAVDKLLRDNQAERLARFCDVSPMGWSTRLSRVGESLSSNGYGIPPERLEALRDLRRHDEAARQPETVARLEALVRLVFALNRRDDVLEGDLSVLARWYVEEGSFEDALREALIGADLGLVQGVVLEALGRFRMQRRQPVQEEFTQRLVKVLEGGGRTAGVLWAHDVLDSVIAPLARRGPVLMVVLDGLSWSVMRQLLRDRSLTGVWVPWVPSRDRVMTPMLAQVPTATEFSRTSLLTGKLQRGHQGLEKKGFTSHPRLREAMKSNQRARLFHKGDLEDGGRSVSDEVRTALRSKADHVVGVVINAIDDQLQGAEQVGFTWSLDRIAPLRTLLALAQGHRTVVLVGDHGHLCDERTKLAQSTSGATSSRWREDTTEPLLAGEVAVGGSMVETLTGLRRVRVACSEELRYTNRKRGYHGGVTLQEVVTPLVVLAPQDDDLSDAGLTQLVTSPPAWWRLVQAPDLISPIPAPLHEEAAGRDAPQLELLPDLAQATARAAPWIEALLTSKVYQAQVVASPLADETMRIALTTLSANRDRMHLGTLARALGQAESQARRHVPLLAQVLNRDGHRVLSFKRKEDLLELDRALLQREFGIDVE